jgi:hypothetical protein
MKSEAQPQPAKAGNVLNLFCTPIGEVWRVHVRPTWLPRYLHNVFDEHGEAYPVLLDFEDLERQMAAKKQTFEKQVTRFGGIELTAYGDAATALAVWLSTTFASGVREGHRASVPNAG